MTVTGDFDRFFLNLPPFDREKDFNDFWERSINELKKIPMEPAYDGSEKSKASFDTHSISYRSFGHTKIQGELYVPVYTKKPKVIVILPDYNKPNPYAWFTLDDTFAYFFLTLRGHTALPAAAAKEEPKSPGFMIENIIDIESYYLRGIYLDAYRALDMLRLNTKLDCSAMGMLGKGLGSAAAVFAAATSGRIGSLVLDTPSFCHLSLSQNISCSDGSNEINAFLDMHRNKKKLIKKNLTYFDALNFSDNIKCATLVTVGFRDSYSPPQCVFALFNHLLCEKTVEVYPDDGNNAGGETQFKKTLQWFKDTLLSA